jgi:hypothetical protein
MIVGTAGSTDDRLARPPKAALGRGEVPPLAPVLAGFEVWTGGLAGGRVVGSMGEGAPTGASKLKTELSVVGGGSVDGRLGERLRAKVAAPAATAARTTAPAASLRRFTSATVATP